MSDYEAKSNIHCFICNSRAGVSIRNAVQIFSDLNKLPSSSKPLHETISEIVKKTINKDIHSHIVCKKCYRLFQEYDEMQFRMEEIKNELLSQFKKTLISYETDYDAFSAGITVKMEPFKPPIVKNDADKRTITLPTMNATKSNLQPLQAINSISSSEGIVGIEDVKLSSSIKMIRSLPPNVVILSRQGKKIAIQKPNKPLPMISKQNKDDSISNPSLLVPKLKPEVAIESIISKPKFTIVKKPEDATDNQPKTFQDIVELNPLQDHELVTSQDLQTVFIKQSDEENIQEQLSEDLQISQVDVQIGPDDVQISPDDVQISPDDVQIQSEDYPLATLEYNEDSNGELDHVEDEGSDNYVISHMEILDEHDSSSIELEEGTFLMEQAEDGSIIRVLHHPSTLYGKDDSEEGMNADQQSESEMQYEEIHDDSTTINLDSIGNLSKNSFIRIKNSSTIVSDKTTEKGTYFVNGDSLSFDQMVKPVGDNTYHCVLCEVMKKKAKSKKGKILEEQQKEDEEEDRVKDIDLSLLKDEEDLEDPEKLDQEAVESFFGVSKVMTYHLRIIHNVRLHICEVCGEMFRRRGEFTRHMDEHVTRDTGEYKCVACEKVFDSVRLYHSHMKTHHSQQMKQHECNICSRKFGSRKLLEEHNNTHIGVRPYNCDICGKTFASKYTYQSHLKTHMDRPRPYTCAQCGKSFFTMQNLTQHEKTHLGIKDFVCNICGKAFGTQHNLEVHGVVHTGYKPFVCRTCNKAFARRAEIRDHERTHTGERPYTCDICGSTFSQRSNLQSHKRATHFDDKRYKCRNCDKRFKRRRLLEYHIKASHTGERPYKCSTCDSTFVYPEHFKKHLRIHSGEKPYKCEVCDKAFNSRDNRNAHRFIHSDKKPYECQYCGAGFMRKPLLYAHMQSQGHLSDKIVVNQPRLNGEFDASKLEGLGNTFILEDGQEVIINNIKEEVFSEGQLVSDVTLSGPGSQHSQEDEHHLVFEDTEEDLGEQHSAQKLFVRTHVKHGHIIVEGADGESKVLDEEDTGEEGKELEEEGDTTTMDLIDSDRIQIIGCEDEAPHEMVEGADNGVRFFQIRMPNGEKGWVALNSCEETT